MTSDRRCGSIASTRVPPPPRLPPPPPPRPSPSSPRPSPSSSRSRSRSTPAMDNARATTLSPPPPPSAPAPFPHRSHASCVNTNPGRARRSHSTSTETPTYSPSPRVPPPGRAPAASSIALPIDCCRWFGFRRDGRPISPFGEMTLRDRSTIGYFRSTVCGKLHRSVTHTRRDCSPSACTISVAAGVSDAIVHVRDGVGCGTLAGECRCPIPSSPPRPSTSSNPNPTPPECECAAPNPPPPAGGNESNASRSKSDPDADLRTPPFTIELRCPVDCECSIVLPFEVESARARSFPSRSRSRLPSRSRSVFPPRDASGVSSLCVRRWLGIVTGSLLRNDFFSLPPLSPPRPLPALFPFEFPRAPPPPDPPRPGESPSPSRVLHTESATPSRIPAEEPPSPSCDSAPTDFCRLPNPPPPTDPMLEDAETLRLRAAAAAFNAASAAAAGTCLHFSTKCRASLGSSPKCKRAYDISTFLHAYPSTRPMDCHPPPSFPASDEDEPPRETREDSDQDLPVGDGDFTSHTISPLTSSQDPSRLFRRLESAGVPVSLESSSSSPPPRFVASLSPSDPESLKLPPGRTSYAANHPPPAPAPSRDKLGSDAISEFLHTWPRTFAPAGNKGHPWRIVTVAYPECSVATPRVLNGARPHIGRGVDPSSGVKLCDKNTRPPHSP
mmetsp:Transcript_6367/g.23327  ORF Transcript_6367/g.23327 Transcript_6367/m.23327 type:complete len:670 (-) Transcript_6367:1755-3764(-)